MIPPRHFILGTAGHVDHGKSALVLALTGTDPDRLPEEKARGITIDLGFAELNFDDENLVVGVVDVPGHEDFVRNMVAGVGSVDAALLVVAADDGWMPQTQEHLQILQYLGVRAAVIALSKIDLVSDEKAAIASVRNRLRETAFAESVIVATSTVSGRGIEQLKNAIAEVLKGLPLKSDLGKPRLPIDRVFTLKGIGTVVTGSLMGGVLTQGQGVVIQPGNRPIRVRGMQNHNRAITLALPGSRVALNLADVEVSSLRRGDVVSVPSCGSASSRVYALISGTASDAIKSSKICYLHHGSATVQCRIRFIDSASRSVALLRFQQPILIFAGDRFILRDVSQRYTLGGGLVLDPQGPPMGQRYEVYRTTLLRLADSPDDPAEHLAVLLARDSVLLREELLTQSHFVASRIEQGVKRVIGLDIAVSAGTLLVDRLLWLALREVALVAITQQHAHHPDQAGLTVAVFRSKLTATLRRRVTNRLVPLLEQALLADLKSDGIISLNGIVRRASHLPMLPPRLREAGDELHRQLLVDLFNPPSRKQLCPTDVKQQAMRFMIATSLAVELSEEVVISAQAFSNAVQRVSDYLAVNGTATVTQLKTLLASNRRVMVPLLERMDRMGLTQRDGDVRRLKVLETF